MKNSLNYSNLLLKLVCKSNLSVRESKTLFSAILRGEIEADNTKAVLLLLASKGETESEIEGCLQAIREMEPVEKLGIKGLMDTCGTGGDQQSTFNVSTASAFIIAGAGGKVAKHGNRAVSSQCGSSDILKALGVKLDAPKKKMIQAIKEGGIGYFHAPFYHPSFAKVQPIRIALKARTIFNYLGPLLNPFDISYHVLGLGKKEVVPLYKKILSKRKGVSTLLFHSDDGMDEVSTKAKTKCFILRNGKTPISKTINPQNFGIAKPKGKNPYLVKNIADSKKKFQDLLNNRGSSVIRDIVLLNAATGLMLANSITLEKAFDVAEESLRSGKALKSLKTLVKISKES